MWIDGCLKIRKLLKMDEMLKAKIDSISGMDMLELVAFKEKVSMSELSNKQKFYIYQHIEKREMELSRKSAMVAEGEIKSGECI